MIHTIGLTSLWSKHNKVADHVIQGHSIEMLFFIFLFLKLEEVIWFKIVSKFGSYYDILKYIKPRLDREICITTINELKIHVLLDNI